MKKICLIVASLLWVMMVTSSAQALILPWAAMFDANPTDGDTAGTTDKIPELVYGWDQEVVGLESINAIDQPTTEPHTFTLKTGLDIVTHQSISGAALANGDTFTEDITLRFNNGLDSSNQPLKDNVSGALIGGGYYTQANDALLFLDVGLTGSISGYNNGGTPTTLSHPESILDDTFVATFDTGVTAYMYVEGGGVTPSYDMNGNLDPNTVPAGQDVLVATFTLTAADTIQLNPSVFSGGSFGDDISYVFGVTYANPFYFPDTNATWPLSGLKLVTAAGGIQVPQPPIVGDDGTDILFAFQETGFDANLFTVTPIPEPASMLLLGTGLAGLAGVSRRRKKAAKK